ERALGALPRETPSAVRTGIELVLRQMREAMRRQGLEEVAALGADFDPAVHEAVQILDTNEHPDGAVVELLQRGYILDGRLVRPAMVKVARRQDRAGEGSEAPPWAG